MLLLQIAQQSIVGDILSPFIRLFRFIGRLLLTILLLPYYIVKYLLLGVWKLAALLLPEFYEEDLKYSFHVLLRMFALLFFGLTVLLLTFLTPLYFLSLLGAHGILPKFLYEFDFLQALIIMGKTVLTTEVLFFALSLVGFLAALILTVAFISAYTPLKVLVEFYGEITESKAALLLSFGIAVIVFFILYLLLRQVLPI